jgi:tRNA (cytidine/uridine-2'-O-)-methyltransferase
MRLALFEPDIPQNTGALLRLGACLDVPVDIIEPCGFLFGAAQLRRSGMDYLELAVFARHASWEKYLEAREPGRIVLLTTRATMTYDVFSFAPNDTILLGRESAGVPDAIHHRADARLRIAMKSGLRSLNVAQAAAMVLGEALRQTESFPR